MEIDDDQSQDKNRQGEELRKFFAKRVIDQVRHLMEIWRLANDESWSQQRLQELKVANEKLIRYAKRFDEASHLELAQRIDQLLNDKLLSSGTLRSTDLEKLSEFLQLLSQAALRKNDATNEASSMIAPKKPIYVMLNDWDTARKLARQLQFFGFRAAAFDTPTDFLDNMNRRYPAAFIVDIDFLGPRGGVTLLEGVQANLEHPIPTIFISHTESDVKTRLTAARLGGLYFQDKNLDMGRVIEEIEAITNIIPPEPFRVLVVEDSKSQSFSIEKMLNVAGVVTRAVNDPLDIMVAMEEFQPEIILMDMYMPGCTGVELARVIRQQEKYVSIPIVFLSSEGDVNVQLKAMSEGGDDFLTKPIKPEHLRSTIRAKAERTRALVNLMIRDSLTGLLNHTSILNSLEAEVAKAKKNSLNLCFAMVDIDHFKNINDSFGHPVGDKVIRSLSLFLKQRLRKSDAIGRYGGEEFAVVMPNTSIEDCIAIFEDIRVRFAQLTHNSDSKDFNATFSCGIAALDYSAEDKLTVQADTALYHAKRGGRNQICTFENLPAESHADSVVAPKAS
jgi:diguanylate cyclase (GGDEF)-like protein